MFNIFKKISQIIGNEPLEIKHLGQFSHVSKFVANYEGMKYLDKQRINTDIYLNVYSANSAKIKIDNRLTKFEYHLVKLPFMSKGYETFTLKDSNKEEVILGLNESNAILTFVGSNKGVHFTNS